MNHEHDGICGHGADIAHEEGDEAVRVMCELGSERLVTTLCIHR